MSLTDLLSSILGFSKLYIIWLPSWEKVLKPYPIMVLRWIWTGNRNPATKRGMQKMRDMKMRDMKMQERKICFQV